MHHEMYLIYVDESGDTGLKSVGSPTDAFVLAALCVRDDMWLETLDQLVAFRRFVRQAFGLRQRDELKAGFLVHGTGPFAELPISPQARMRIYRQALRLQVKIGSFTTWAVAIDKNKWEAEATAGDIRETAWTHMLQRIERFTHYGRDTCILMPDEGHAGFIQALTRRMRRHSLVGSYFQPSGQPLSRPATLLVEDPNIRRSQESYFVQLADLNAYAAYRHLFPQPWFGADYWDELGDTRNKRVNYLRGGPTGIAVWP